MINNDILRRVRYIFDFNDSTMIEIFAMANLTVKRGAVLAWLAKEDNPAYQECNDRMLATFLNGLIIAKRGKRDGPQVKPEMQLNNNLILTKLKIALSMQSDELIETIALGGFELSAPELSSFFRRPGHKNYRECQDQILRYFLKGLQVQYRGETLAKPVSKWPGRT